MPTESADQPGDPSRPDPDLPESLGGATDGPAHGTADVPDDRPARPEQPDEPDHPDRTDRSDRPARGTAEEPRSFARRFGSFAKELLIVVVGALIIAALIRAFVGQMFLIPSGSMEHTLDIDDRIAAQKITDFQRGDIVVFADPGDWLPQSTTPERGPAGQALEFIGVLPDLSTEHLVKRVIGMPGDHVKCCDDQGRITVNGQPLDETGYLYSDGQQQDLASDFPFDVVVPADRIWVMGDHRSNSEDSRCHLADPSPGSPGARAFVPVEDVVGPVFAVVAPFDHAQLIRRPPTFEAVPDAKGPPPAEPVITGEVRC